MTKRKGIIQIVTIVVLTIIGVLLATCSFTIPFTTTRFVGFANGISLGIDLKGGVVAVYNASIPEGESESNGSLSERIEATKTRIRNLLTSKNYTEAQISNQGDDKIRIEVPNVDNPDAIFDLIGKPASLLFSSESTLEAALEATNVITGKNVKNVEYGYNSEKAEHGVSVEFDTEGSEIFANLTEELAGKSLYIYLYDPETNNVVWNASPSVEEKIAGGKTFISGNMTKAQAEEYALQILSGTYSVNLSVYQNTVVSAQLGVDALKWGIIAGLIGLALIFIFMCVIYRGLGAISCLSLTIYAVLLLFFLNIVPGVQLSLPGIAGIVLSLGMAVDANIVIFERIKDEYKKGKKLKVSIDEGYKRSIAAIVDGNVTTIIAAIILMIFGTGAIKGFAITLLIGIALSLFTGLLITKGLINVVYKINSTKASHYALKRKVTVNE